VIARADRAGLYDRGVAIILPRDPARRRRLDRNGA